MDTTQVPEFKLAKVGKRRERKKAGFFWLNGGASGGAFSGATGGMGALAGKIIIAVVLGTLSVGAYNVGTSMAPNKKAALQKPKAFAAKEMPAAAANAVVGPAPASGLAMVEGSLDGKTPEQRAAEAAAAEAAAKAEADKKAQEEAAAKKAAEEEAKKSAPAVPDPASMIAAAQKDSQQAQAGKNGGKFANRFGQLSSSLGGGHSGLAGGAGLSGGIGRTFTSAPSFGKAQAQKQAAEPGRTSAKAVSSHGHSSRAFRQLVAANQRSQHARQSGSAETAVQSAGSAFENNPGANSAITGGGAGAGGAGTGDHTGGSNSTNGSGNTSGPTGCGGECAGGAPKTGHKDDSPWHDQIVLAARLTVIASALLMVGALWSAMQWPYCKIIAEICGGVAAAMGAVILGLGASISGKGGPGTMYMISGGVICLAGALVAINAAEGFKGVAGISSTMITWGSVFTGLLSGASSVQTAWGKNTSSQ